MKKQLSFFAAAAVAAAGMTAPVFAATVIDVTNIDSQFTNWNPALTAEEVSNGLAGGTVSEIRWPAPASAGDSGYRFTETGTPVLGIDPVAFAAADLDLGTFEHLNFPISSSIDDAELTVSIDLQFRDDVSNAILGSATLSSVFSFDHNETPNGADPCADGGANGVGINGAGCADSITVTSHATAGGVVVIGGTTYELAVEGLLVGGVPLTTWWTAENADNAAELIANLKISEVPVPAAGFLLLGALGGLGFASRRRKKS